MKTHPSFQKLHSYLHTIRARILLSTIFLILLISIAITMISHIFVSDYIRQNMIQTSESKLSLLCVSIDSNINSVKGFVHSCKTSSEIRKFAMEGNYVTGIQKSKAKDYIMELYTSNAALPSQLIRFVITANGSDEIIQLVESPYSSISVSAKAIRDLPYFGTLKSNPGIISKGIVPDPFIQTRTVSMIPFIDMIPHPYRAGDVGYIFVEMSPTVITTPLQGYLSDTKNNLFFRIGDYNYQYINHELISYDDNISLLEDLSSLALDKDTIIQRISRKDGSGNAILISRPLNTAGWYVTELLDETLLNTSIRQSTFVIVTIILLSATLVAILFSLFLNHTINVPVKKLQNRMTRIAKGDFSRDTSIEWEHELGEIGKNINDLSENVLQLMNQKLEDERQKKDYEYKMLQSQINPHFLYNTLNSIKWMATIQNSPGIAEMTTALSRLLKDISKGASSIVSIEHELTLIQDYYTIQQYRYGGTITLSIDIEDDSLLDCSILKFTLQPIVENAIFHGIEPKLSAGTITIHIYQDETSDVHIDVTDDGVGMTPEVAARLLDSSSATSSSFFKQIGICNVHKRLQYEFGDEYGLSVSSKQGEYTTISILLPFEGSSHTEDIPDDKTNQEERLGTNYD